MLFCQKEIYIRQYMNDIQVGHQLFIGQTFEKVFKNEYLSYFDQMQI